MVTNSRIAAVLDTGFIILLAHCITDIFWLWKHMLRVISKHPFMYYTDKINSWNIAIWKGIILSIIKFYMT